MVELLSVRPHSVSALAELCGISVTGVGQHIQLLEGAGLVASSKLGRVRSCQLRPDGFDLLKQWLLACRSPWDARLDALGAVLEPPAEHR